MNDTGPEALKKYREQYPKQCAHCGGELEGPTQDDAQLIKQIKEHDEIFPGESLTTATTICDACFQAILPGGKQISMN